MIHVGVRELKNRLSEYLAHVKAGEEIIITEHKKPVARIVPPERSVPEAITNLVREGSASWSGLKPGMALAVKPGDKRAITISDIVIEDRR